MEVFIALVALVIVLWAAVEIIRAVVRFISRATMRAAVARLKDFEPTWILTGVDARAMLAVDEHRSAIAVVGGGQNQAQVFSHREIHSVEIIEDGVAITRTDRASQVGTALVGGAIAGPVGMLAAAVTAKKISKKRTDSLAIKLVVNAPRNPVFSLCLYRFSQVKENWDPSRHSASIELARLWEGRIALLVWKAEREHHAISSSPSVDLSLSSEISRLADLNKSGALTDDEFRIAKRKLLTQLEPAPVLKPR